MSRVHTEQDFYGNLYTEYRWYPFFSKRADAIDAEFGSDYRTDIMVVAGSGWGFLVEELSNRQWNQVYGLDASSYAVHTAAERELPTSADRILEGDVLEEDDLQSFRNDVGRPWFVLTEDLLPCAINENEVQLMLDNLRDFVRPAGELAHIITPKLDYVNQVDDLLWLTKDEWKNLIGNGEKILFAPTYGEWETLT